MKKYEENVGNMKIRTLPVGLGKISSSSSDLERGMGRDGSQFPGLGVPQRKDKKHVNTFLAHPRSLLLN